ncbi:hypothetical protein Droror1_Dr00001816 [Drosera rotundifolia]
MWLKLVKLAKEGDADVIESYVFWNGHELSPGKYYFEERFDLVKFIKIVQEAGMYMMLRIGPFVCGEWNLGGVPVWLHYEPVCVQFVMLAGIRRVFKEICQGQCSFS